MVSLKQIRYALALEKHLHFRKAAADCSISQSALSTSLSEMEKLLGFAVFERDNKKVLITPVGSQFLDKARNIKLQVDDLMNLADRQRGVLSYSMRIGMIPSICPYLLPKVLPALNAKHPKFELNVFEEQSESLVEKVRTGEIDTAILALPYATDGLLTFEFWQEDLYWIAHHHDVSNTSDAVTAKELEHADLILLREGHCLKDHALSACQLSSDKAKSLNATSLTTLIQLVRGRFGSTLVPELALDALVHGNSDLTAKRLVEPGPHRRLAFVVRPNYTNLDDIDELISIFRSELATKG